MNVRLIIVMLGALVAGSHFGSLQAEELSLQKDSSKIEFVGSKPEGNHKGGFKKFEVAAVADFESPQRSSINIQIDTTSLWSDDDRLTNHLKSPDFFNVRKHPAITFESTAIVPGNGEEGKATITGMMQMLGKSVEVQIPAVASITDESIKLTAEFTIDRTKWGMVYGQGKVNNDVKISAEFTLKR